MTNNSSSIECTNYSLLNSSTALHRIIAMWGFSEAVLGGLLHALRIPLTGLFVGGTAVLFISLIACSSNQRGAILKATMVVILIKAFVSPHSPITAYFAVFLQGIIGEILFGTIHHKKASAFLLGVTTLTIAGFQKILILTLVFGNTLWDSIDVYTNLILKQFLLKDLIPDQFSITLLIMSIYVGIHTLGGIFFGWTAAALPKRLSNYLDDNKIALAKINGSDDFKIKPKISKRKKWWQKPSGIIFIIVILLMFVLSYIYPELGSNQAYNILIMLVRSTVILFLWFTLLSPIIIKQLKSLLMKKRSKYADEVDKAMELFPQIWGIVKFTWGKSAKYKKLARIKEFIISSMVVLLISNFEK